MSTSGPPGRYKPLTWGCAGNLLCAATPSQVRDGSLVLWMALRLISPRMPDDCFAGCSDDDCSTNDCPDDVVDDLTDGGLLAAVAAVIPSTDSGSMCDAGKTPVLPLLLVPDQHQWS